jgi:hypothetical protein
LPEIVSLLIGAFDDPAGLLILADLLEERGYPDADVVRAMVTPGAVAERLLRASWLTAGEALALPLRVGEKLDLVLDRRVLGDPTYGEAACLFAEHVLPIFEAFNADDRRPREAIETSRRWRRGGASDSELYRACHATRSAAKAARKYSQAASYAATAAGAASDPGGGAGFAARYARLAAGEGEIEWQMARLARLLEEEGQEPEA